MNTPLSPRTAAPRTMRGMSIIELMVGLVIGLLVSLAAVSSAQYFMAAQRQGIGVGSGGANTASALASIKNDVSNGGLGFFGNLSYVCNNMNLSIGNAIIANNASFAPVQATRVGTNDQLDVVYGTEVAAGASVKLATASDGTSATLKNYLPVTTNQAVLITAPTTATPCLVRTVTNAPVPPTADTKEALTFDGTGTHNQAAFAVNLPYPENSLVSVIGVPVWNRYSVNGGNLQLTQVLTGNTVTLLRNVIGFRVEYGVSAAGAPAADGNRSTLVQPWQKSTAGGWTTVDNTNIARIKALRITLVVRSAQREKVNRETGLCEASTTKPKIFAGMAEEETIEPDVTDWKCYRYRTQTVIAPMRNIIYGL